MEMGFLLLLLVVFVLGTIAGLVISWLLDTTRPIQTVQLVALERGKLWVVQAPGSTTVQGWHETRSRFKDFTRGMVSTLILPPGATIRCLQVDSQSESDSSSPAS